MRILALIFSLLLFSVPAFADDDITLPELPLVITPAAAGTTGKSMVLMLSGDGGWTNFDQELANQFAKAGLPVAGLNSLKYFWNTKTPGQATTDAKLVIDKYRQLWKKSTIILVGYSFGADVMPFIYNQLPASLKKEVENIVLLSPSENTDFEIHITEMLHFKDKGHHKYNVYEELKQITTLRPVCFFGKEEKAVPALFYDKTNFRLIFLKGGHHYEDATPTIVKEAMDVES